jgi:PAS domain S-box-containing protein
MSRAPSVSLVVETGLAWAPALERILGDLSDKGEIRGGGAAPNGAIHLVAARPERAAELCAQARAHAPANPLLLLLASDAPGSGEQAAGAAAHADSLLLWPCAALEISAQLRLLSRLAQVPAPPSPAPRELLEARERLRAILAASDIGTWHWFPDTDQIFPDTNLARFFGFETAADGLPLQSFLQRIHSGDRERVAAAVGEVVSSHASFDQEFRVLRPDGSTVWLHARGRVDRGSPDGRHPFAGVALDISALRNAQTARHEVERLFHALQEASPNGFMVFRAVRDGTATIVDFDCIYSNPVADRVVGRGPCAGRRLLEFTPGNLESGLFAAYVGVAETGAPWRNEFHYDADGLDAWFSTTAVRAGDGFAVTFVDISERKRAEQSAAKEHGLLEAMLEACPAGIIIADAKGRLVRVNPANIRLWGPYPTARSVEEYRDWKGWWADGSDRDGRRILPHEWAMARALRGETQAQGDLVDIEPFDAPGTRRTVLNHAAPVRDAEGTIIGGVIVQTDLTAWRRTEEDLRRSEERFRRLAESLPHLVWIANREGQVDYYNHRAADFSGIHVKPDGRWEWAPVLHPEDEAATVAIWRESVRTGAVYQAEHRLKMADGSYRWHLSRGYAFDNPDGTRHWFGTATDIDAQKRHQEILEETVQERTASLQTALAELETFSYSLAHDMRAPLRALIGFSQFLVEDHGASLPESGQDMLRRIAAAAARMDQLIRDVLCYSKIAREPTPLGPVGLGPLLEEILATYPALHEREAEIIVDPALPVVRGHDAMLLQIFSNLLGNAVKFVPGGRRPLVRVFARGAGPGRVRVHVADNGIGVPPEHQARIFQIFQRLDGSYEGTGIGLSIVQKAAERLGGSVGVETGPGGCGSVFWVELLLAP